MSLLLTTTLIHTFIASFVWQCPFVVNFAYMCFAFFVHYQFGLGSNLIPIYILSCVGCLLGYWLSICTTATKLISRCNWTRKINIIFWAKLFVLFVIYVIYEVYGPSAVSIPLLFVAVLIVVILAWIAVRNECVLVPKAPCEKVCNYCGCYEYVEKKFGSRATSPAAWLILSVLVLFVTNMCWLLVLFGITWVTPLRIQCLSAFALSLVVVACIITLNCVGSNSYFCRQKKKNLHYYSKKRDCHTNNNMTQQNRQCESNNNNNYNLDNGCN